MGVILDLQGEKVVEICFTTVLVYLKTNVINFMLYFTIFFFKARLTMDSSDQSGYIMCELSAFFEYLLFIR